MFYSYPKMYPLSGGYSIPTNGILQPKRYQLPPSNQGTIHKSFHKATLNPGFEEANKTQKGNEASPVGGQTNGQ
jgi:hypothetical protein